MIFAFCHFGHTRFWRFFSLGQVYTRISYHFSHSFGFNFQEQPQKERYCTKDLKEVWHHLICIASWSGYKHKTPISNVRCAEDHGNSNNVFVHLYFEGRNKKSITCQHWAISCTAEILQGFVACLRVVCACHSPNDDTNGMEGKDVMKRETRGITWSDAIMWEAAARPWKSGWTLMSAAPAHSQSDKSQQAVQVHRV